MRPYLDSVRSDALFGLRQLRAHKLTSAAAIVSLALAIGACTSAFRLLDALLWRPLPVANPERLHVVLFEGSSALDGHAMEYDSSSYPMFTRMRDAVKDQAELVAVSYADRADLTYGSDPDMERAYRQYVSGRVFPALGLRPAAGRLLDGNDDQAPGASPYAVVSFDYWSRRFGRDPRVVGRTFRMGDTLFEIVGVAQENFTGTETGTVTDIFFPMAMKTPSTLASPDNFWLRTLVKLNPSARPNLVEDRLVGVFRTIQAERARTFLNMTAASRAQHFAERMVLRPAASGRSNMQRDYRRPLLAVALLVALVLLIACANVANLMTARVASRGRETAIRVSVGAGRYRLIQLVLAESAWLALAATALGTLFAWWAAPSILGIIDSPDAPARLPLSADWRVIGFSLALTLAVTLLFGLIPALRSSAMRPALDLKARPHVRRRLMHFLVAVQVAFCFLVLLVAGLFFTTFQRLATEPTGFSSERILNLETVSRSPQPPAVWAQIAESLRAVPGVEKVALTGWPTMSGEMNTSTIALRGGPPEEVFSDVIRTSPGWNEIMKIPLIDGRDFRPNDATPGVAIVNQAFARQYFGGANPTGKRFEKMEGRTRLGFQIVGYARDFRVRDNPRVPVRPTFMVPFASKPVSRGTYVVRTSATDPLSAAPALRRAVSQSRSEFFVENIRTQTEILASKTVRERLLATLALFFAAVALIMAGVGLYGMLDYAVLQRTREIGIRIAVGARAAEIARLVTNDVLLMVLTGSAAGLLLGLTSLRSLESLFFEVKPGDAKSLMVPALTLGAAALLAAAPAVVRAVRIDLVKALRAE